MANNEDTIVMGNNNNVRPNNNSVPPRPQQQAKPNAALRPAQPRPTYQPVKGDDGQTWKRVALGGVAGIMFGTVGAVGATTAYYHFSGNGDEEVPVDSTDNGGDINLDIEIVDGGSDGGGQYTMGNGMQVAEVDQSLSFGEAFAAARAEVGPGGVFEWHGGVYGTYTADEWNSMSTAEHNQFAHLSQPVINEVASHHHHHTYDHVDVVHTNTHVVQPGDIAPEDDVVVHDDWETDDDVEIVGIDDSLDGTDGNDVFVVDTDGGIDVEPIGGDDGDIALLSDDGGLMNDDLLTDASLPGVDNDGIPDYTNDAAGDVLV